MGGETPSRFNLALARLACRYALNSDIVIRSLYISAVVGTILNLINQGDAILRGWDIHYGKLALTYVVPYLVGTYGAVAVRLRDRRRTEEA
ncbi:MAG: nitrate/nitrite transporter NrtS [Alphaproteobacteria bacterium]